jgi:hypothetical protein
MNQDRFRGRWILLVAIAAVLAGCGPSGSAKGKVKGKVVANGQPVTGGSLTFSPTEAALPAGGDVLQDGTFVIRTEGVDDGAAIGKHTVTYNAPGDEQADWDGYGTPPPVKVSPYKNLVPATPEVEVKAGQNEITIELVPARVVAGS